MSVASLSNISTEETKRLEDIFRAEGFADVQAYRHSSVSLRLRIRDERFRGLSRVARMNQVEPIIDKLPQEMRDDLIFVLPIAPGEEKSGEFKIMNIEFEEPRPVSY